MCDMCDMWKAKANNANKMPNDTKWKSKSYKLKDTNYRQLHQITEITAIMPINANYAN